MAAPAIIGLSSRPKILTKFVQGFSQRRSALKFVGINSASACERGAAFAVSG
jgi:hypothetical protein